MLLRCLERNKFNRLVPGDCAVTFDHFLVVGRDNLPPRVPVHLVAIVVGRVVTGRDADARVALFHTNEIRKHRDRAHLFS